MTNQDFNEDDTTNTEQPVDPFQEVVEKIQFGSIEDAAGALRSVMATGAQEAEINRRRNAELTASHQHLKNFERENPGIANDKLIIAAVRERLIDEQREDLARVGVDLAKVEQDAGRKLTGEEVANAHLAWRVAGSDVRRVPELLETATNTVSTRFNLVRRSIDPSARILAQKNATRAKRGLAPVEDYTRSTDSDSPTSSDITAETFTKQAFGDGVESLPVLADHRANAVQKMKLDRLAKRERNVGQWEK
jgi:hypothetical protein